MRTGGDADARGRLIGVSRMTRLVDTIRAVGLVVDERFLGDPTRGGEGHHDGRENRVLNYPT